MTNRRRQIDIRNKGDKRMTDDLVDLDGRCPTSPAETWPEAAAKAQYLLMLFEPTPEALEPERKKLIARTRDEFARLSNGVKAY
jgi:hypothetical protein